MNWLDASFEGTAGELFLDFAFFYGIILFFMLVMNNSKFFCY